MTSSSSSEWTIGDPKLKDFSAFGFLMTGDMFENLESSEYSLAERNRPTKFVGSLIETGNGEIESIFVSFVVDTSAEAWGAPCTLTLTSLACAMCLASNSAFFRSSTICILIFRGGVFMMRISCKIHELHERRRMFTTTYSSFKLSFSWHRIRPKITIAPFEY